MKKLTVLISLILVFSLSFCASASLYDNSYRLFGDVNNDGLITTADAKLILRAAAGLEELTPEQKKTADVFQDIFGVTVTYGSRRVTPMDAKTVLRIAAGLNMYEDIKIPVITEVENGDAVAVIGPLPSNVMYDWKLYLDDRESVRVEKKYVAIEEGGYTVVGYVEEYFTVTFSQPFNGFVNAQLKYEFMDNCLCDVKFSMFPFDPNIKIP